MSSTWIAGGALLCALSVLAGAFGAHGLESRLDERGLALWETSARYLMYSGLGVVLMGLFTRGVGGRLVDLAAGSLLVGALVFSGTVAVIALGGPRWLGAVTPLGGLLMIVGFVALAWAGFKG